MSARHRHPAILMDGNRLLDETVARVRDELDARRPAPRPCLATVLVGDDGPSERNARAKHARAEQAGMTYRHTALPAGATQAEVEAAVRAYATDPEVHGVFVQLPLPPAIDTERVLDLVPVAKDVDGLSAVSLGRLIRGQPGHVPCTPRAVLRLLERYRIPTAGRRAVVIGRSRFVGLPLCVLLGCENIGAVVTLADAQSDDLAPLCREADIVVAAANVARLVTADHVRPGATVIDVGVTRTAAGIVGDIDFDAVRTVAGAIAPMPGGTGPATIACLLENTLAAAPSTQ